MERYEIGILCSYWGEDQGEVRSLKTIPFASHKEATNALIAIRRAIVDGSRTGKVSVSARISSEEWAAMSGTDRVNSNWADMAYEQAFKQIRDFVGDYCWIREITFLKKITEENLPL